MKGKYEIPAAYFKALGHPTGLQIVDLLYCGEKPVVSITSSVGISQPSTSQHLKILRIAGIVKARRNGHMSLYSLSDDRLKAISDAFRGIRRAALIKAGVEV